ncbi:Nance-Horan syndrome protein-like [Chiloscyllium plagiosum]|uniref:Nance-Horan syndrome protein-like n=1 Tax=Chiloscyllium plagiosum TaxID=36176 RepID=UPI001CB7C210|nr:Nance-Horan syndrome protein-like [Chiloscyllium plagiosum]
MPFPKRICEPLGLCRPPSAGSRLFEELPGVCNHTLGRSLRQLSELARHASGLFQEIEDEVLGVHRRLCTIQRKISELGAAVKTLEPRQQTVRKCSILLQIHPPPPPAQGERSAVHVCERDSKIDRPRWVNSVPQSAVSWKV